MRLIADRQRDAEEAVSVLAKVSAERDEWRSRFDRARLRHDAVAERLRATEKQLYKILKRKYNMREQARDEILAELADVVSAKAVGGVGPAAAALVADPAALVARVRAGLGRRRAVGGGGGGGGGGRGRQGQ